MNECFTHQPAFSKHILATDQNLVCTAPNKQGAQFPEVKKCRPRYKLYLLHSIIILDFITFFCFVFLITEITHLCQ